MRSLVLMDRSVAFTAAIVAALILCSAFCSDAVFAETYTVPGDYDTIQDAIDDVSAGDVISVDPGVYDETIDFLGKAITVQGAGADETIIGSITADGEIDGSVVTFDSGEGSDSILEAVTIRGGTGTTTTANWMGVGFSADYGGGIYISSSSPTLRDCLIENNDADVGGGLYAQFSELVIEDCHFTGNSSVHGVGVYLHDSDDVVITSTVIDLNEASSSAGFGGGLVAYDCEDLEITDSALSGNAAFSGAGCYLYEGSAVLESVDFNSNDARNLTGEGVGGGISIDGGDVVLNNCRIANNIAVNGGGVVVDGGGTVALTRCLLFRNDAEEDGGAILGSIFADTIDLVNCTLSGNEAESGVGDAIRVPSLASGVDSDVVVSLRSTIVWDNGDPEEAIDVSATLTVDYCDVEGGDVDGEGNIDEDPEFVAAEAYDFRLQIESPCIDSGDESDTDPDGSRADIGALPHKQDFLRGDVNSSGLVQGIADTLMLLEWQFGDGAEPLCMDAADVDDNGRVHGLVDSMALLHYVFSDGDAPPDPGTTECGEDPTDDDVECDVIPLCP